MDREKVVVTLLLITIILSVVSLAITLGTGTGSAEQTAPQGIKNTGGDQGVGRVNFEIVEPSTTEG